MQKQLNLVQRELKIKNYSPKTVKSYLYGLKKYFTFKKRNLETLDQNHIKEFLLYCEQKGISAQSRNLFLSAIKFYYRNLVNTKQKIEIQSAKKQRLYLLFYPELKSKAS